MYPLLLTISLATAAALSSGTAGFDAPLGPGATDPMVTGRTDTGERISSYIQEESAPEDSVLLDATWMLCEDSTESLLMMRDGATIYAVGDRGVAFRIGSAHLAQVQSTVSPIDSQVDTAGLDSCNTIGLILSGPRYLLLNRRGPTDATRDLLTELRSLRKYARRRMGRDIDRSIANVNRPNAEELVSDPTLHAGSLERGLYRSPIVRTWPSKRPASWRSSRATCPRNSAMRT